MQHLKGFEYEEFTVWVEKLHRNLKKAGFAVMAVPTDPPTVEIWRDVKRG